jgi:hypothetical protein
VPTAPVSGSIVPSDGIIPMVVSRTPAIRTTFQLELFAGPSS